MQHQTLEVSVSGLGACFLSRDKCCPCPGGLGSEEEGLGRDMRLVSITEDFIIEMVLRRALESYTHQSHEACKGRT